MFYFEQDKRDIRGWLKAGDDKVRDELREEIQAEIRKQHGNFITAQQLKEYDVNIQSDVKVFIDDKVNANNLWVTEKIDAVRKAFDAFIADDFDRLKNSADATAQEVKALKAEVDALEIPPPAQSTDDLDALKKQLAQHDQNFAAVAKALNDIQKNFVGLLQQRDAQILSLKAEVDKLKAAQSSTQPTVEVDSLKTEVDSLKTEVDSLKTEVDELKTEVDKLKAAQSSTQPTVEVDSLKDKVDELERRVAKLEPLPEVPDDEKFFLLAQNAEFLPADRKQIPAKVKEALNLSDIEKFLTANTSAKSRQFQRILADHAKEVKRFVDKLKLDGIADAQLSENVTEKYFKLFQRRIFDNLLIAIRSGLKTPDKTFYADFLKLLNDYLMRCGIYSLNVTSGRRADSDDYENMTPQVIKPVDETLAGTIDSIERLPYRINYRDEFGEQNFFQYAGIMNVYKAV